MWTAKQKRNSTAPLTGAYNAELSKADVAIDYLFRFDADRDGHISTADVEAALKTLKQVRVASGWSLYRSAKDSSVNEKVSMFNETQFLNDSKAFYEALLALGRGTARPQAEALGLAYALRQDGATKSQIKHYLRAAQHAAAVAS